MNLGMSQTVANSEHIRGTNEGTKLKAENGWIKNGNGNNESGFNALPGGLRNVFSLFKSKFQNLKF